MNETILKISKLPTPGPDVMVIAIGTNDAHDGAFQTGVVVDALLDATDEVGAACTALVNVAEIDTWQLDVYGAALDVAAGARDDVLVADWAALVEASPDYLDPGSVHHTGSGEEAYRDLIVDAAGRCADVLHPAP